MSDAITTEPPAIWQRVDAFSSLLAKGQPLLSEVVTFVQRCEEEMKSFSQSRAEVESLRTEIETLRNNVQLSDQVAAGLREQVQQLREENERLQTDLSNTTNELAESERQQTEARQKLEEELARVRAAAPAPLARQAQARLVESERRASELVAAKAASEEKLRLLEQKLALTQQNLEAERERRSRMAAIIRPTPAK